MNRLSNWIVRRPRPLLAAAPGRAMAARTFEVPAEAPAWLDDVRLFLTGWCGGLIFFGTLLG